MSLRFAPLVALVAIACSGGSSEDTAEPGMEAQVFEACVDFTADITEPNPNVAWTANAVTLVSEELAPGVFAVLDANAATGAPAGYPLATSGGFVIGSDGVALVETMWNQQLFCQMVGLVQEQTAVPVRYAINTGHHADHNFGNTWLPDDVEVVQHERTAGHLEAHFADEVAFSEMNFGADQGFDEAEYVPADIEVDDDGWSVDLGGITVEAQYHGIGQSEGDLFVYVPDAEVMWTGNPLTAEEPALPWLLEGHAAAVSETLGAVQSSLPADAIVVPGHGRPVDRKAFSFSIDYLDTLVDEVQASVDAGNDLPTTQGSVVMQDFQGYALWDFAHSGVNVPMTFGELSQ